MKKILYVSAVTLTAILGASCTNDEPSRVASSEETDSQVTLSVSIPVATRTTTTSGEETVNSLQVFIFREDGLIDAAGSATGNSVSLVCTMGERDIVAVVNAPTISGVSTKSEFDTMLSGLGDNSLTGFVMYGEKTQTITESASVEVPVSRLVARVSIDKITNSFSLSQYQSSTLVLTKIYLINVAGDVVYSSVCDSQTTAAPTTWYNKMASCGEQSALTEDSSLDATIVYNSSYETPHYFYCYPNPTEEDSSSETWSPRFTRLVVEVTLAGTTMYYPISIEGIESNHTYQIAELKLTKPGSDSPDEPIDTQSAGFTITVNEWETGYESTIEI